MPLSGEAIRTMNYVDDISVTLRRILSVVPVPAPTRRRAVSPTTSANPSPATNPFSLHSRRRNLPTMQPLGDRCAALRSSALAQPVATSRTSLRPRRLRRHPRRRDALAPAQRQAMVSAAAMASAAAIGTFPPTHLRIRNRRRRTPPRLHRRRRRSRRRPRHRLRPRRARI